MKCYLSDVKLVEFPVFNQENSCLYVYENGNHIPFDIPRLFLIKSSDPVKRGFHAHKKCSQILITINGACTVFCDDGRTRVSFLLNKANEGLLVPPTIWAEQEYEENSCLMVLTDMVYDEDDYIRNYTEFLDYRAKV